MPRVALDWVDYLLKLGHMLTCARHGLEIIIYLIYVYINIRFRVLQMICFILHEFEEVKLTQTHLVGWYHQHIPARHVSTES